MNTNNILETTLDGSKNTNSSKKQSERFQLKNVEVDQQYTVNSVKSASSIFGDNSPSKSLWRLLAIIVSWASIIVTFAIGVSEFVVANKEDSTAAFGLAFSAILDVLTSSVVVWRYYRHDDLTSKFREYVSCIFLGCLFVVSAIGIAWKAIYNLRIGDTLDLSANGIKFLIIVTSVAAGASFVLFVVKAVVSKKLSSWTLFSDALNSLMGTIIALSMIITTELTKTHSYLWYLDSTIGLAVSLFFFLYGVWLLVRNIPKYQGKIPYKNTI